METVAVTPEQGRQIVQHLKELKAQLWKCYSSVPRKLPKLPPGTSPFVGPDPEFIKDQIELNKLSNQVEKQVEQKSHVEKQLLIEINEKLGDIQNKYGNILIFSATVAAIISGLKDLIDLLLGK